MLLKHENILNDEVRTEFFNMDWRRSQVLSEAQNVNHSTLFYVEEMDRTKAKNLNNLRWHQAFLAYAENISFKINNPHEDPEGKKFLLEVTLSRKAPLSAAKERISELLNLPLDQFFLRRSPVMRELKNMEISLQGHGIQNYTHVQVVLGKPSNEGFVDLRFREVILNAAADSNEPLFETLPQICKLQVPQRTTIAELKEMVALKMEDAPELNKFIIRNPKSEDIGEVLLDNKTVEESMLYDEKELYIQRVAIHVQPTLTTKENDSYLHLLVREFNPHTWELSPVVQFRVSRKALGSQLASFLSTQVFPHIPQEMLFVTKHSYMSLSKRGDLALAKWSKLELQKCSLETVSLSLTRDALLFVVKDGRNRLREELTHEEFEKYASTSFKHHIQGK